MNLLQRNRKSKTDTKTTKTKTKTAKAKERPQGYLARRSPARDAIAEKLAEFDTVQSMYAWAKKEYGADLGKPKKLEALEAAIKSGLSNGLVRMRIGNFVRGAIARRDRNETSVAKRLKTVKDSVKRGEAKGWRSKAAQPEGKPRRARRNAGVSHEATPVEVAVARDTSNDEAVLS